MRIGLYLALAIWTVLLYIWTTHWYLCHMEPLLKPFLININKEFQNAGIPLLLDGGTLLGAMRDHGIITTEMDLDVAINEKDFERGMALKSTFLGKYGYHLYGPTDYIFQKAYHRLYAFEWEPYLNDFPCMRLYDDNKWWYADIYCYTRITRSEIWKGVRGLPPGYNDPKNADRKMLTVYPYSDIKAAVVWEDEVYPTQEINMWGEKFLVPGQAELMLETQYGETWRVPYGKGVRILYCNKFSWFLILVIAAGLWAYLAWKVYALLPKHLRYPTYNGKRGADNV